MSIMDVVRLLFLIIETPLLIAIEVAKMSILIRGMEMPKDCLKCPFCLFADGYWKCLVDGSHADFGGTCRPQNCPLIPVPPHGRLIDADELFKEMERKGWFDNADRDEAEDLVLDAPTILEAEEGER